MYLKRDISKLACSPDYKSRFIAEYLELKDRMVKLDAMLFKYMEGTLKFTPDCPIRLLRKQSKTMHEYLLILEDRAGYEDIDLNSLNFYIKAPIAIRELPPKGKVKTCRYYTLGRYQFIDHGSEYQLVDPDGSTLTFSHADEGKKWEFVYHNTSEII